jgi:hypothetical protein
MSEIRNQNGLLSSATQPVAGTQRHVGRVKLWVAVSPAYFMALVHVSLTLALVLKAVAKEVPLAKYGSMNLRCSVPSTEVTGPGDPGSSALTMSHLSTCPSQAADGHIEGSAGTL